MKKAFSIILAVLMLAALIPSASADDIISFGRVYVAMPEVKAEIKGTDHDLSDVSATLGIEKLELVEGHAWDPAHDTCCAYVLVDVSGSMSPSFYMVRQNVRTYAEAMGPNDRMVLIAFGGKEVTTLLKGDESREEILKTIDELQFLPNGDTPFYEALSRAYQMSNSRLSEFDREYVLTFSDGEDFQKGITTFNEVTDPYKTHTLPLYAACAFHSSKDAIDHFGELARSSGGSFATITRAEDFDQLLKDINDVTILNFRAPTNIADGTTQLLAVLMGKSRAEINIPVTRSIPDNIAPTVEELHYDAEKNQVYVRFSERVKGALSAQAYKVQNSKGDLLDIGFVESGDDTNSYLLTVKGLTNDTYSISIKEITDASHQANQLVYTGSFEITTLPEPDPTPEPTPIVIEKTSFIDRIPLWVLILLGLVAIGCIALAIILAARKHGDANHDGSPAGSAVGTVPVRQSEINVYDPVNQDPVIQHHIKTAPSSKIRLRVKTGSAAEQTVETVVTSSIFVGRSDTCDVYIDDAKLSRQHFVIELEDGRFYLTDLQSRNGTFLNGTRVVKRHPLQSGDKISAGLSDIVISF